MPEFVQREVRERARTPSRSDNIVVLVGYTGDGSDITEFVNEVGGEVVETLPFATLNVSIPETALEGLLTQPSVESVELDGGMETLQGN